MKMNTTNTDSHREHFQLTRTFRIPVALALAIIALCRQDLLAQDPAVNFLISPSVGGQVYLLPVASYSEDRPNDGTVHLPFGNTILGGGCDMIVKSKYAWITSFLFGSWDFDWGGSKNDARMPLRWFGGFKADGVLDINSSSKAAISVEWAGGRVRKDYADIDIDPTETSQTQFFYHEYGIGIRYYPDSHQDEHFWQLSYLEHSPGFIKPHRASADIIRVTAGLRRGVEVELRVSPSYPVIGWRPDSDGRISDERDVYMSLGLVYRFGPFALSSLW